MFKKALSYFLTILLIICLTVTGSACSKNSKAVQEQSRFDIFLNDLFVLEVQSDTLSLNYSLANPENYGIQAQEVTLGEFSVSRMYEELSSSENHLKRLQTFDFTLLTPEQRLSYDIIKGYLEQDLSFGNFLYYSEVLSPTTGIQTQLPILLAEYSFYTKKDIREYLELLPCVYDYFKDIAWYEREKSEHGLFMSDKIAKRIIAQCEAFIENPENNYLIHYFNEKISKYKNLSEEEVLTYEKANKEGVLNYVIPAYELLIEVLNDLLGTGTNEAGLYYYPEGQSYYECLAKYKTGSNKSMEDMIQMLDNAIRSGVTDITMLSLKDPTIVDQYLDFTSFPLTDPVEILNDLREDITTDFPEAVPVNCEIKYVPDSLSDYLSPALYLVPPMDSYQNNDIYINGNDPDTLAMIYTTVAHEGYPGHLYQCVYFRNMDPAPVRNIMNFVGYDEGWATYVEMYSYQIAGINENLADFLAANNLVILCMYARADMGIHYEGWTKKDTVRYINNYIGDTQIAAAIYETLLEEPAIYLPYAVGCLEIMELKDKAMAKMGDSFVMKDFHKFLLDIGPAQFGVIENYMGIWVENGR